MAKPKGEIRIPRDNDIWELNKEAPLAFAIFTWLLKEASWKDHEREFYGKNIIEERGCKTVRQSVVVKP